MNIRDIRGGVLTDSTQVSNGNNKIYPTHKRNTTDQFGKR